MLSDDKMPHGFSANIFYTNNMSLLLENIK